jgi:DMSO/TMAO reductase YedYZ molybdopterin-dependent catalytic subunit
MFQLPRRDFIIKGSAALAAFAVFHSSRFAQAFPSRAGETVVPWLDQPAENPVPEVIKTQLVWEDLDSWVTPNDKFFSIAHFDRPVIDANSWKLEIDGLVNKPMALTLADLKARPRQETVFTVECSGNHGFPFFTGGIGKGKWYRSRVLGRRCGRC